MFFQLNFPCLVYLEMFIFNVTKQTQLKKRWVPHLSRILYPASFPYSSSTERKSMEERESVPEFHEYRDYKKILQELASNELKVESHSVVNQAQQLEDNNTYDLYDCDQMLKTALQCFGGQSEATESIIKPYSQHLSTRQSYENARLSNKHLPTLNYFDRYGHRIDEVEYHPSYHTLMKDAIAGGMTNLLWQEYSPAYVECKGKADKTLSELIDKNKKNCNTMGQKSNPYFESGRYLTRGALLYMHYQLESGTACPLVMTSAASSVLKQTVGVDPYISSHWLTRLNSNIYDPRNLPIEKKFGATMGMSMTEKQGGSDVRANSTIATQLYSDPLKSDSSTAEPTTMYALNGHKWFTSAPMSDGFLTLSKIKGNEDKMGCFLVPRWLPDGSRNVGLKFMRLKDKLGDKSNASSEVEYHNAIGYLVGEETRGVRTIIDMVQHTRLDCALGSAGLMRQSLAQALYHNEHRVVFGKAGIEQPLMVAVLADLCIESEAATILAFRMAKAFDDESPLARIGTAIAKYWLTKRCPQYVYECMEAHGGNGYVEDFPMARHFRQSPLNSIWEGSGNVICLDVLRALSKEPDTLPAIQQELLAARGMDPRYDGWISSITAELDLRHIKDTSGASQAYIEMRARRVVDRLAVALCGSLLIRFGDPIVADHYLSSRLGNDYVINYGTIGSIDMAKFKHIINRNMPVTV